MELDSSELLKRFVAAESGLASSPAQHRGRYPRQSSMLDCASDAQIRRDLAIVFRKDKSLSRAAKAFMDIRSSTTTSLPPSSGSVPSEAAQQSHRVRARRMLCSRRPKASQKRRNTDNPVINLPP